MPELLALLKIHMKSKEKEIILFDQQVFQTPLTKKMQTSLNSSIATHTQPYGSKPLNISSHRSILHPKLKYLFTIDLWRKILLTPPLFSS
jgi:hypothetical protein